MTDLWMICEGSALYCFHYYYYLRFQIFHYNMQDIEIEDIGEIEDIEDIEDIEYLTLEAKNREAKANDEFQLVANMEITAAEIAKWQLSRSKPLHKIHVWGALLDFHNDVGTCFSLTMDFIMCTSKVKKQVNSKFSVAQAVTYLLDRLLDET